jgi:hypothetical protein
MLVESWLISMVFGKREKILASVFGLILYVFILYKFVVIPFQSDVSDKNDVIHNSKIERDNLDRDLQNINLKTSDLNAKKANDDRLQNYLMENANILDGIDYINKLSMYLDKNISVNITAPEKKTSKGGKNYYELKMSFNMKMKYEEALKLVQYIEGGSLKAAISSFTMTPATESKNVEKANTISPTDQVFNINMTTSLYSLNSGTSDKMFEYSRQKFSNYSNNDGVFFVPSTNPKSTTSGTQQATPVADITIKEGSFLSTGGNLKVYGKNMSNGLISVSTNKPKDIQITFEGSNYTITTTDDSNKKVTLTDKLPDKDISLAMDFDVPNVPDNKDIRLNLKITNNTAKNINISLNDKDGLSKIMGRDGKAIYGSSTEEKVTIK